MAWYFWWFVVCMGIWLIGLTKSGFGAGVGLLIVPVLTIAVGHLHGYTPSDALGLMLPLLVVGDLLAVWQYRKLFSMDIVKHLLPGTVLGVVVGGVMLWWFKNHTPKLAVGLIKTEIGIECVFLVGLYWWRQWRGVQTKLMKEPLRSHLTGAMAGTSSTLANAAGPIIATYLLPLGLDRQLFVGTSAIYFFTVNVLKLPAFYYAGHFARMSPTFSLQFLPLVILGALAGFWVNKRVSDKVFGKIVYMTTFVLGLYLLGDGVVTLIRDA